MKITLLIIGKTDAAYIREGIFEYEKRLKHYINFNCSKAAFIVFPETETSSTKRIRLSVRSHSGIFRTFGTS